MRIITFVTFSLVTTAVFALTLKETKIVSEWKKTMENNNKTVKDACGKDIKFSMDESTWVKEILKYEGRTMTQGCDGTMNAIAKLCLDADAKPRLVKKISSVKCFPSIKDDEVSFQLSGGVLKVTTGINAYPDDKAKEYLENNL